MRLDTASLLESDVDGSKRPIEPELVGEIFRYESVAAASHAIVQFGKKQNVAASEAIVVLESIQNAVVLCSSFNIPCEGPDG